jgi:RNA polymerase sigma factor (sigma-70 family)
MRDRDTVAALVAGDPDGLADAYDRYAAGLYGYCRSLLGGPDEAPDAVQETFIIAAAKVGALRGPDRLRAWLYAVARSICTERLREQGRAAAPDESELGAGRPELVGFTTQRAEQRHLVLTALAGLSPGDREVAELVTRHDLEGADLAAVLGVPVSQAGLLASRARIRLSQVLGPMMVARTGRRGCVALDELLDSWSGDLTPPWRRKVSRHAATCPACAERMHWALGPAVLLSLAPLVSPPAAMRGHILDLVADDRPDAVAYRGRVAGRAGPFDPAGFPVQIAPAGWAGRSGRSGRGRRGAAPEPGQVTGPARRRVAAAAVASLLVVAAVVGGITLASHGAARGRLTAGGVGTAAPFGVPGSAASGDPAGSLPPRSPSGKPVLARTPGSGSPSPSSRAATSPAAPSPHRTATSTSPPDDPPPSHTSAPPPPPPVLSESPGTVVLEPSEGDVAGSFTLTAANGPISYSISTESRAVSVSVPLTGTVTPGQPLTVTVTYRGSLGPLPDSITVNGFEIHLTVPG